MPHANTEQPWPGCSPAVRAPLRSRRDMGRLAHGVDVAASSMPRSRSPTCSSPLVTGHEWPNRRGTQGAILWREKALQFTGKSRNRHPRLPITGSAHNAGMIKNSGVRTVLTTVDVAAKGGSATTLDRGHHASLGE